MLPKSSLKPLLDLTISFGGLFALFLISTDILAAASGTGSTGGVGIGAVSDTIKSNLAQVAQLITAISYVAGIGFALMGLTKLKAHKDNPQQTPLSQPVVLLVIAAGLVFLPSIIKTAGQTIWGEKGSTVGTEGGGSDSQSSGDIFKTSE